MRGIIDPSRAVRSIAVISDTHIGSPFAPWPDEEIWTAEGNNISNLRNGGQLDMLSSWKDFIHVCEEFNVDTIIHLGDATQGTNPKEGGKSTLTPDLEYQKDAAEVMLRPLVTDRIYHQLSGTLYHESRDVKIHRDLVKRLSGDAKEANFHGPIANLRMVPTKKVFNLAHAATSALIYPSTVLDREGVFLRYGYARDKLPKVDVMIRGHLHYYMHLDYPDLHILQCPAWQAWYPLRDKVRLYGKMQPDIGGLIILIDEHSRMVPLHFLYPVPKIVDFLKDG